MKIITLFFTLNILTTLAFSEDCIGFGNFNGNFKSLEKGIITNWDKKEPQKLWSTEVGLGFSSIIEVDGFAFLKIFRGKNTIYCLGAEDGKIIWKSDFPCSKSDNYFKE